MDQRKTFIPHFKGRKAKAIKTQDLIKTHVTAVLDHGAHEEHLFLDKGEFPHDANMTIAILSDVLWAISKRGKPLPPVLYLQADIPDNCWRENKNSNVLAYCETLVSLQIFNEVQFAFLYVGHTHEDVDQYFSVLANKLRRKDAETLPELFDILPDVAEIQSIPNFREWITPLLNPVSGHTQPLQYRLVHKEASTNPSKVDLYYRGCSADAWKVMGSLLNTKLTQRMLNRRPANVIVNLDNLELNTLHSRIKTWSVMFDHTDPSTVNWWKCFADDLLKANQSERQLRLYSNRGSRWHLPKFSRCRQEREPVYRVEDVIGPHLVRMLNEETREPQVTVRTKKKQTQARGPRR